MSFSEKSECWCVRLLCSRVACVIRVDMFAVGLVRDEEEDKEDE